MYVYVPAHLAVYTYVCIWRHIHACMHTYVRTYIQTDRHTYMHTLAARPLSHQFPAIGNGHGCTRLSFKMVVIVSIYVLLGNHETLFEYLYQTLIFFMLNLK